MSLLSNFTNQSLDKFQRRVNVNVIDEIWAADLIDMLAFSKDNNGIKYLLTVIDVFSKFAWIVPLKRKTEQEVANAFSRILRNEDLVKRGQIKAGNSMIKTSKNQLNSILQKMKKNLGIERDNRTITKCLSISLLITPENLLICLTYLSISTIIQFIHR